VSWTAAPKRVRRRLLMILSVVTTLGAASCANVNNPGTTTSPPAAGPTISSFAPQSGTAGTSVVVTGTNFAGTTSLTFNGTSSTFVVNSATQITATVPAGATTGKISDTTPSGATSSAGTFTVTAAAPTITSFAPTSGVVGASVTITGTNLAGATTVSFNGTAATFTVNSATQITAAVPSGATTGKISLTAPGGTVTSSGNFTVSAAAPTISSFTPTSGATGTSVAITGTNLAGASALSFNGTPATFTVQSATQIATSVPAGATTGSILVTTPGGSAASPSAFTVTPAAPTITSFTPTTGTTGTSVAVTGTNLTGASAVKFNGTTATFTVNSSTKITAGVPPGATTGKITATTPGGTATSAANFSVSAAVPTITSFTPTSGVIGVSVTLGGANFTGASSVKFNGTAATTFTVNTASQITAIVPTGSTSGTISVTTPAGTASSSGSFTVNSASGLDLTIDGLYVTQAAQDYPTAVPLVLNRSASVRVFVKANQANTATPQVRVVFSKGSTTNTLTINAPAASVPTSIDANSNASWNAAVPAAWIQNGAQIVATVDPSGAIAESDRTNNQFSQTMDVRTLAQWRVTLVPVQTGDGRVATIVSASKTALSWVDFAKRLHPVPDTVDVVVGSKMTSSVMTLLNDGSNWGTVLSELNAKHNAEDPHENRYYYGVVSPNYSSGVVGLGYVGAPSAIGWDKDSSGVTLAHEEGHNMGDSHSPCGGVSNPDPNYPYAGGTIGVSGWDVFATTGNFKPTTDHDIMGYCNNNWISDYVYKNELAHRASNDPVTPSPDIAADNSAQGGLLVWGRIENGKMILEPAFRLPIASAKLRTGNYLWQARDAQGQVLASVPFDAPEIADLPEGISIRNFAFVVPMSTEILGRVKSLHVSREGVELARQTQSTVAAFAAQEAPNPVEIQPLANHSLQLSWDAAKFPVLMLQDARTGEVRGFVRGGKATLRDVPEEIDIHYSGGVSGNAIRYRSQHE